MTDEERLARIDIDGAEKRCEFVSAHYDSDTCWKSCKTIVDIDVPALIARVRALEAQAVLDAKVIGAARALIVKGEPIVAKDDVELQCSVCHGTRWGPCEDIPVAEVLNDTVQHTDDCEWVALAAALATRGGGKEVTE